MNEVEKMYENAGIKYYKNVCSIKNLIDTLGNKECYLNVSCYSCPLNKSSFTAEKQIELIKWLAKYDISIWHTKVWDIEADELSGCISGEVFENVLAQYINYIWQDLTEEERKQIKEMLE